ncbi:MAG: hypothetical protein FFODKBPE_00576 [Candidatus Argoarchaeum ethanivorans]|uniref:Uncharacterized protein n=1 Tax=Candidatus Argoarchaeum ethanivorans TaxID=2608793 RepID=A0A811T923_9EURY|nr:MAG: hypothetical protein FFODKBPE_00576 [Candidatus Argoarchaeum ethanivorans]
MNEVTYLSIRLGITHGTKCYKSNGYNERYGAPHLRYGYKGNFRNISNYILGGDCF